MCTHDYITLYGDKLKIIDRLFELKFEQIN